MGPASKKLTMAEMSSVCCGVFGVVFIVLGACGDRDRHKWRGVEAVFTWLSPEIATILAALQSRRDTRAPSKDS